MPVVIILIMCLVIYFITASQKNRSQNKPNRREVDDIIKNVQESIAKANGSTIEHYSLTNITAPGGLRDEAYKKADFINKHCTRLEDFIINNEINGFDLLKLAELNGIQLQIAEGWYPLVIGLINELNDNGWDKKVSCIKEKYAGLRFHASVPDAAGNDITKKYERKSEHVCETCGEEGKIRYNSGWDYVACRKHYVENRGRVTVQEDGFMYNGNHFIWADIKDMRFEDPDVNKHFEFVVIECHKNRVTHAGWRDNKLYIKKSTIGYGHFISHIKTRYHALAQFYVEHLNEPEFCEICSYKAVYADVCECCETKTYIAFNEGYGRNIYSTSYEYIKEEQLDWAADNGEVYEQRNNTYAKNPDYKILYTAQELEARNNVTYWDADE